MRMLLTCLTPGAAAALLAAGGCYSPGGGLLPRTGAAQTYWSTEIMPATVTIVDTRTEEAIFSIEIPVGKQLTFDFVEGEGDDPVMTPDLMRYQVFDLGTSIGKLRNSLTVPNRSCRRIDVDYRPAPEYRPVPPEQAMRLDDRSGRPGWWTPRGGPIPDIDAALTIYDD